jgi:hypothetical protein
MNLPCIFIADPHYVVPSVTASLDSLRTHQVSPGALHPEVAASLAPLKVIAFISSATASLWRGLLTCGIPCVVVSGPC